MYPIFVVLLDGLADRAHDSLGGRTANEVADTPNLDRLAAHGLLRAHATAVGPGRAPSSEIAHWAMLGYTPEEFPGRAVLEAVGRRAGGRSRARVRVRGAAPGRAARRRALAHRPARARAARTRRTPPSSSPPAPGSTSTVSASSSSTCPPRRGDPPCLPGRRRPSHRLGRVLQGPLPGAAAAAAGAGGRGARHVPPRPGRGTTIELLAGHPVNERRAVRGAPAAERDHAQVVGPHAREPELPRAPRPARQLPRRLEVPARPGADDRPRAALRRRDG